MQDTRSDTCVVYPWVEISQPAKIGDFVIVGQPIGQRRPRIALVGPGSRIRSHSVIYEGNIIGRAFATGHGALIREDNKIGDDVSVGSGSVIEHDVVIGHRVRIHSQAFVPEFTVLEDDCWIGPRATFTNARYPGSPTTKENLAGATVASGARVGANATLLPGVRVGKGSLVGAGAVVTVDVPDFAVVVGNPARVVGDVRDQGHPGGAR